MPLPLGLFAACRLARRAEYAPASPRKSYRHIPVGVASVHNQVFRSRRYVYAIRFVVDRRTRVWRFQSGFRLDGADRIGGSAGYADGGGGTIRARLVRVDKKGRPGPVQGARLGDGSARSTATSSRLR